MVLCECRHVDAILLGELLVDEAATLVAPPEDELVVLWRDDDQREGTDMIAELRVLLLVALEHLAMPGADLQEQLTLVAEVASVDGIEHGSLLPVLHGEAVGDREVTLGEGEVVQRIQQVGLPHPIEANEAIDLGGEGAGGRGDALEVQEVQTLEDHRREGLAWSRAATSHLLLGREHTAGSGDIFTAGGADRRGVAA